MSTQVKMIGETADRDVLQCSLTNGMRILTLLFFAALTGHTLSGADILLGIIGTDTSHTPQFTRILNDNHDPEHVPGARVVAAYKGGSPDIPSSRTRVDVFAEELSKTYHTEIVPDLPTLCSKVDAILLLSIDGRAHLAQAKAVIAARKPLFIDLPIASTLEDTREIARLAKDAGVRWFSASAARYNEIATKMAYPDAIGVDVYGPGPVEEHHYLDLSFYAIHPIELLFTLMGRGCEEVTRVTGGNSANGSDVIVGRWKGSRVGSVRTLRPYGPWGGAVMRPKQVIPIRPSTSLSYAPLVRQIVKFFVTGKSPVSSEDTLEIYAFMDAAQRSKAAGGQPMRLR